MLIRNRSEEDNWRRMAFQNRLRAGRAEAEAKLLREEMEAMQRVIDDLRGLAQEPTDG